MTHALARPVRVNAPDDLLEPALLETLLGPIASRSDLPLACHGYSGAVLQRIEVRLSSGACHHLVYKRLRLAEDWTAYRTGDALGRQAALLAEPRLAAVWDVVACPYRAFAIRDGDIGLLMTDLTAWLLPDVDAPLYVDKEDRLLATLASLHARFWQAEVLDLAWLARPAQVLRVLGPEAPQLHTGRPLEPLFELVRDGWAGAMSRLPRPLARCLLLPADEVVRRLATGLPRTLLHGDAKVANFALLPTGVAAFDWSWVGAGPCTLDLGWYLAINAGRLARSKELVIQRYRELLERAFGARLSDELWARLLVFGLLGGARMLLWEKALSADGGSGRGEDEWAWWLQTLEAIVLPHFS